MSRQGRATRPSPGAVPRTIVTATGPGDLVAAVPYLVGFTPTRSLVMVSLRGPRLRFGLVARVDLPAGDQVQPERAAVARSLCDFVRRDGPREAVVLVYDTQPWRPQHRPWQQLVDAIDDELAGHDVPVREALYVTNQRYWSYTCTRPTCCPDEGRLVADTASSAVAAAYVLEGRSPFVDRPTLAARVAPLGPLTTAAVEGALTSALAAVAPWWARAGSARWTAWQRESIGLFDAAAHRYLAGPSSLPPHEAGRLLAAMVDATTRDVLATRWTRWCEALAPSPDDDALTRSVRKLVHDLPAPPDLTEPKVHEAVERLLVDLAVCVDGVGALAPLALLAMHSWSNGEGARAGVAIDRALVIDPEYRLAGLVDSLLRSGLAPSWVADLRADDEAAAPRRPPEVPLTG